MPAPPSFDSAQLCSSLQAAVDARDWFLAGEILKAATFHLVTLPPEGLLQAYSVLQPFLPEIDPELVCAFVSVTCDSIWAFAGPAALAAMSGEPTQGEPGESERQEILGAYSSCATLISRTEAGLPHQRFVTVSLRAEEYLNGARTGTLEPRDSEDALYADLESRVFSVTTLARARALQAAITRHRRERRDDALYQAFLQLVSTVDKARETYQAGQAESSAEGGVDGAREGGAEHPTPPVAIASPAPGPADGGDSEAQESRDSPESRDELGDYPQPQSGMISSVASAEVEKICSLSSLSPSAPYGRILALFTDSAVLACLRADQQAELGNVITDLTQSYLGLSMGLDPDKMEAYTGLLQAILDGRVSDSAAWLERLTSLLRDARPPLEEASAEAGIRAEDISAFLEPRVAGSVLFRTRETALVNLLFSSPLAERSCFPLSEVAEELGIQDSAEVQRVCLGCLSKKVIAGRIDGVRGVFLVERVMPRRPTVEQLQTFSTRLSEWSTAIQAALRQLKEGWGQ